MAVGDAVVDGEAYSDAGGEDAVEFSHAFDYPGGLLGDEADYGVGGEGGPLEVCRWGAGRGGCGTEEGGADGERIGSAREGTPLGLEGVLAGVEACCG